MALTINLGTYKCLSQKRRPVPFLNIKSKRGITCIHEPPIKPAAGNRTETTTKESELIESLRYLVKSVDSIETTNTTYAQNADVSTTPPLSEAPVSKKKASTSSFSSLPPQLQAFLDKIPPRIRGLVMANTLVVLVATNWVIVKDAGTSFDPFLFAALRFSIAAAALSPFVIKAMRRPQVLRAGVELGIFTAIGYLAQSEGLLTTDASRASFLSTFTVLVVPFLAGLSGRGVQPLTWVASGTALAGVALLEQSGTPPCIGDVWSIISAVAFGVQIFRTEHWSRLIGKRHTIPLMSIVLTTTALVATAAAVATHPADAQALLDPFTFGSTDMTQKLEVPWGQVLYTGLLTTDVALLMELIALRDITSTECAVTYTMEPVLGAGFAFALLGEKFEPTGWLGAALIIFSCLGMQVFGKEEGEMEVESSGSDSD